MTINELKDVEFLEIVVPWGQLQAHDVEIKGAFDSGWGMYMEKSNPNSNLSGDRLFEITLTNNRFHFRSLYLNACGYLFHLKLLKPDYEVVNASSVTTFRRFKTSYDYVADEGSTLAKLA